MFPLKTANSTDNGQDRGIDPVNTSYTTRGVATHEMGHALGLDHSPDCAIMNAYTSTRCGLYQPTYDDINGINALY